MHDHDVLFIVLDSARRDRVSAYGHDRDTTPTFDALAEEATLYENAYTPAPWTLPSHAAIFTGRYPTEHGVTNGFADRSIKVPAGHETVAERLQNRGYRTGGFTNNPWVGKLSGLDRGFDEYVEWDLEISRSQDDSLHGRKGDLLSRGHKALGYASRQPLVLLKRRFFTSTLVERAQNWLTSGDDAPTFTFMNLMEAHSPYYPPKSAFRQLGLEKPGPLEARRLNTELLAHTAGKRKLSEKRRQRTLDFYDASLRYQDGELAAVLSALKQTGRYDDTLIVVCADHGKTIGEFDRNEMPTHYVRDVNAKVPLLVKWPGQEEGERVADPVDLVELFGIMVGDDDADSFVPEDGVALTQDSVPHTGSAATDVTGWTVVSTGSAKLARTDTGTEYFFTGEGPDEEIVSESKMDSGTVEKLRQAMDDRLESLRSDERDADDEEDAGLDRNVQGQLKDLGYL